MQKSARDHAITESSLPRAVAELSKVRSRDELLTVLRGQTAPLFGVEMKLASKQDQTACPSEPEKFVTALQGGEPFWMRRQDDNWCAIIPCDGCDSEHGIIVTAPSGEVSEAVKREIGVLGRMIGVVLRLISEREMAREERSRFMTRHRNLVSTIRAVGMQTAETSRDLEQFQSYFTGRLDALSRGQAILSGDEEVSVDLLVREEFLAETIFEDHRIRIEGPDLTVDATHGEGLSFAIHELLVNSIQNGAALGNGTLTVRWWAEVTDEGETWLCLKWQESSPELKDSKLSTLTRSYIVDGLPFQYGARSELITGVDTIDCKIWTKLRSQVVDE